MGRPGNPASEQLGRPSGDEAELDLEALLDGVAHGDQAAFEAVYDRVAGPAFGLIRTVVQDPAQSAARRWAIIMARLARLPPPQRAC